MPVREHSPDVRLRSSPTRCPYCHDEVREEEFEDAQVCLSCLARHHADCWVGSCAMCGTTRALGEAHTPTAVRPTYTPFKHYPTVMRWGNRLTIILFVLYFALMFVSIPVSAAFGLMDDPNSTALPWPMIPGMVCGVFLALTLIPVTCLNFFDGVIRCQRDASCGFVALSCVLLSICSGGLSGMAYYLRWGWQPLPAAKTTPRRRPRRGGAKA